jgi:hypothetical protein
MHGTDIKELNPINHGFDINKPLFVFNPWTREEEKLNVIKLDYSHMPRYVFLSIIFFWAISIYNINDITLETLHNIFQYDMHFVLWIFIFFPIFMINLTKIDFDKKKRGITLSVRHTRVESVARASSRRLADAYCKDKTNRPALASCIHTN